MTPLCDAGITKKLKKCKFFAKAMNYLGHVIPLGQLAGSHYAIDTTCDLNTPTSFTELRSFRLSTFCTQLSAYFRKVE